MRVHTTALLPHTIQMSCSQQQPSVSRHAHQNQKTTLRECFVSQLCLNDTCWACHDDSCTHGVHASLSVSYNVRSDNTTHLKCSCTLSGCRLCASPANKSLYMTQVCELHGVYVCILHSSAEPALIDVQYIYRYAMQGSFLLLGQTSAVTMGSRVLVCMHYI